MGSPREGHEVAKEFLDAIIRHEGFDPDRFYLIIRILEEIPDITNVAPALYQEDESVPPTLTLDADYVGPQRFFTDKDAYESVGAFYHPLIFFHDLEELTGLEFLEAMQDAAREPPYHYSAIVRMGEAKILTVNIYDNGLGRPPHPKLAEYGLV
ncbi:MAG TPA: hypothetical protein VJB90_02670 [Candidatus Nanoarchaeia archaeon]|nr:hypothetical protein [Candidatus Nanoarchaeia archaeon]